ncbi:hypothetical protein [Pelistega ratti]|uniref:hypothetical protein n=1 Tax=Pelistega ratti TaxID=2652177 RepID=UPI00135A76EC|nr:hypothetical protein [Pelistega ratti]
MLKKMIVILLSIYGSTTLAQETSYQVGYSKKEDIKIVAENATKDSWCQSSVHLQFLEGNTTKPDSVPTLFSKLDKLFTALKCPTVETIHWKHLNHQGSLIAKGTTTKANGWQYSTATTPTTTNTPIAAEDTNIATEDTNIDSIGNTTTVENTLSTTISAEIVDHTPNKETSSAEIPHQTPTTITTNETTTAINTKENTSPNQHTDPIKQETNLIHTAAFSVGSWTPPTPEQKQHYKTLFTALKDQNGCIVLMPNTKKTIEQDWKSTTVETTGAICDSQGYLHGAGTISLIRTDGVALSDKAKLWFQHGLPFSSEIRDIQLDNLNFINTDNNLYFFTYGSNTQDKSHYFIPTELKTYTNFPFFNIQDHFLILTALPMDNFKKVDFIRPQVDTAMQRFIKANPNLNYDFRITFLDDLPTDFSLYDINPRLYSIRIERPLFSKKDTPWQYNLKTADNYVYQREEQQRRKAFRQKQQLAYQEQERLEKYHSLKTKVIDEQSLQSMIYQNIRYTVPFLSTNYDNLYEEDYDEKFSSIIHITDSKDGHAIISFPYEMHLLDKGDLAKGWYLLKGHQKIDKTTLDSKGLPITLVTLKEKDHIYPCQEEGCKDMLNPTALIRYTEGIPDWDPVKAKALIDEVANHH